LLGYSLRRLIMNLLRLALVLTVIAMLSVPNIRAQELYEEPDMLSPIEDLLGVPIDAEGEHYQLTADYAARFIFGSDGDLVRIAVVPIAFIDESHSFDRFSESLEPGHYEWVLGLLSRLKPIGRSLSVPTEIGIITNLRWESVEYRKHAVIVRGITADRTWYFDVLFFHPVEGKVEERHPPSNVDSAAGYQLTIGEHTYYVREPDHLAAVHGETVSIEAAGPRYQPGGAGTK
jgi:hypothetical protein